MPLSRIAPRSRPSDRGAISDNAAVLFDGSPADAAESQWWRALCDAAPAPVRRVTPRDAAAALADLTAERTRRETDRDGDHPPLFVCVYNVSKFRDLRKGEDEYSFGGFGSSAEAKPVSPGQQFAEVIAQGPEVGIHVIVWCDSAGNLERWFSRATLKELERRVAFQMNAADSSNLIDSPAASRLGVNRALLYREETGTVEKFRPYGAPSLDWLASLRPMPRFAPAAESELPAGVGGMEPHTDRRSPLAEAHPPDDLETATDLDAFIVT